MDVKSNVPESVTSVYRADSASSRQVTKGRERTSTKTKMGGSGACGLGLESTPSGKTGWEEPVPLFTSQSVRFDYDKVL